MATSILGDQGADVIKVEVPASGDHTRNLGHRSADMSSGFLNINRSKRSITLNLKHETGQAIFKKLAATADALVQNFRPGVVERLGIAENDIREVSPGIVYVSMSGFGERGPWSHKPVYDPVIQALSGLATIQAGSDAERPRLVRTVLPDKLTAITASQTVTAALLSRERTGEGQHVRLSMLDSLMAFLWGSDMGAQTFVDKPVTNQEAASFIDLIYETKDGYMTVSAMGEKEWQALVRAFDKPELLEDPLFLTTGLRDKNINERLAMTQEQLLTRTTGEWMTIFDTEGVPSAPAAYPQSGPSNTPRFWRAKFSSRPSTPTPGSSVKPAPRAGSKAHRLRTIEVRLDSVSTTRQFSRSSDTQNPRSPRFARNK